MPQASQRRRYWDCLGYCFNMRTESADNIHNTSLYSQHSCKVESRCTAASCCLAMHVPEFCNSISGSISVTGRSAASLLWEPLLNHPRICSLSSNLDALTTELLEALWWAGSKFNYNYTTHRGLYRGLARNRPFTSVWDQDRTIWVRRKRILRPESSEKSWAPGVRTL